MHEAQVKKLQAISFRERWPTEAVYDDFDVDSYLFGTDQSPGSQAAQVFLLEPPPKDGAEERGTGPLGPAMEFKFLQLTRQYLLRQNADEATIQHIAPFLVPCQAAVLYRHLREESEDYDDQVLVDPEAIVYGRIRLPLSKAVLPVLSKIDKFENEVRVLRLGLQDATEQGREREVQLAAAVQHSETLQAEAARREEDLKRSQGTVVELRSTLDGLQRQLLDSQVQLQNSKRRAAEDLHQVRTKAAQERMESDVAVAELQKSLDVAESATKEVQAARSKDLAEREEILVAALNKNAALEGNLREQKQELAQLRSSLAQLNHAARSSDAMDIDTETKQAQPPTGSQVRKSDSDRIEELERLLEEAKAENERLEEERDAAIDDRDNHEFILEQTNNQLQSYATKNPELEASLKAAKDEVDRQRKMANGLEDEVQKLRSYSNQTFAGHHELDRLRVELNATCVVKGQLGRQVGNLRGILERTERDLVTLRSQRGPSNETWMEEFVAEGERPLQFHGNRSRPRCPRCGRTRYRCSQPKRRRHQDHQMPTIRQTLQLCRPGGCLHGESAVVKRHESARVVYMESSGRHHAELWLVMDYIPTNLRALIYDHNRRPTIGPIKYYVKELASGLAYLHRKEIHHGDLKPDNVLVGQNHQIKIADFDVSEDLTNPSSRRVFCSLNYRAPEILFRTDRRTVR